MFGTVVEHLETAIDEVAAVVASVEAQELSRSEALDALVAFERLGERLELTVGALASDLQSRDAHRADSATSMATWLSARTGQARSLTGSQLHLAHKLRSMPATRAAVAAGEITHSHARVLARALTPRTAEAFARDEAGILVGAARKLTADQLAQVVEFWLRHNDPDGTEPGEEGARDRFFMSKTLDGRLKGNFDLGGDLAITVALAIDEIVSQLLRQDKENRKVDPTDPGLSQQPSERRARALGELCTRAGASPKNPARRQPLVVVHTTIDTLAETGDPSEWMLAVEQAWSSVIPLHQAHLWTCDCWLAHVVIRGTDGEILSAGRKLRVANRAMRRALVARDGNCCAVPGCDRRVGWCQAHHIIWWENGGLTEVDNLVFVCAWHHARIHPRTARRDDRRQTPVHQPSRHGPRRTPRRPGTTGRPAPNPRRMTMPPPAITRSDRSPWRLPAPAGHWRAGPHQHAGCSHWSLAGAGIPWRRVAGSRPRSSADRASASGAVCAGSSPAGGTSESGWGAVGERSMRMDTRRRGWTVTRVVDRATGETLLVRPGAPRTTSSKNHMPYHMVMSRREVLVQLDDELVERLDRLARAENTSRSELLRRGAAAVIEAADQIDADRTLREAYRRVPQDPALVASARRLASETAPAW